MRVEVIFLDWEATYVAFLFILLKQLLFTVEAVFVHDMVLELALVALDDLLGLEFFWWDGVELLLEDEVADLALDGIGGVFECTWRTGKVFAVIGFELDFNISEVLLVLTICAQKGFCFGMEMF